jgi:uncharacterized protein (TIGR02453 family)
MISSATFQFLKELKTNNNKEWFDANRSRYAGVKKELESFIETIIAEIALFDKTASQTDAKSCIFRINRDIRFSNDKMPYKTNLGAFVAQGGRKSSFAGYYIHIEPGACFLSGGIYMPSAPVLKAIRTEIAENFDEFKRIIKAPSFVSHFGNELWGEKLKSAPRGFSADFEGIDYLKYKHYTVIKDEPDTIYTKPGFIKEVRDVFRSLSGFNRFLNTAVEDAE